MLVQLLRKGSESFNDSMLHNCCAIVDVCTEAIERKWMWIQIKGSTRTITWHDLRQNHRLRQWYATIQKAQQTILFDQKCETMLFGCHKTIFNTQNVWSNINWCQKNGNVNADPNVTMQDYVWVLDIKTKDNSVKLKSLGKV